MKKFILLGFIIFLLLSIDFEIRKISFIQIAYVIYFIILLIFPVFLSFNFFSKESKFKNYLLFRILRILFCLLIYYVIIYLDSNFKLYLFEDKVNDLDIYLDIAPLTYIIIELANLFKRKHR